MPPGGLCWGCYPVVKVAWAWLYRAVLEPRRGRLRWERGRHLLPATGQLQAGLRACGVGQVNSLTSSSPPSAVCKGKQDPAAMENQAGLNSGAIPARCKFSSPDPPVPQPTLGSC